MGKQRVLFFLITLFVVAVLAVFVSVYARGYRFSLDELKFLPNGLFVIKSVPDGAQLVINGNLISATNTTLDLKPGTYDVTVRKDNFIDWKKRLVIDKEVVTEVTVHLFRSTPSLSSVTFSGSLNPVPSYDLSKIAFIVPSDPNSGIADKEGLWVIEAVNLPIGFAQDPKRITDGNLLEADLIWSPDGREILFETSTGSYLIDTGTFTPQSQRVNIRQSRSEILAKWEQVRLKEHNSQLRKLPEELSEILSSRSSSFLFSPDEDMVLYTASASAVVPKGLKNELPGASTQKEDRELKEGSIYVYDIEEDRNFLIDSTPSDLVLGGEVIDNPKRRLSWFATSRHLVLAEKDKVTIMDYDATNRQVVYSGSYVTPHAFPTLSIDRLLILTNLGANSSLPNLYSLSLK